MKQFIIKEETITKVLNYLSRRPYNEVAGLINEFRLVMPVKPFPGSEDTKDNKKKDKKLGKKGKKNNGK